MKIVLANKFFYLKGGAERYFFDLKKLLESHGHEVIPFCMHDKKNLPSKYSKYFVSNIDFNKPGHLFRKAFRALYSFEAKKKFSQLIKDTKPDIIHIHNIYHQISPSILTVAKKHKIPTIQTLHDFKLICPNYSLYSKNTICEQCKKYKYYKCAFRKCIKNQFLPSVLASKEMYFHKMIKIYENNVDLFLAPSQFVHDKIMEWGIIPEEQITVLSEFTYDIGQEETNESKNQILYFGRLIKGKGVDTLISAMKNVLDTTLIVAGTGPQEQELKRTVNEEEIDNVKFVGFLNQNELKQQIKNSLFTIHPSEFYETFGLSILEAYKLGKPVVASSLGALPEIVKEEQTGLLFNAGDVDDLTSKINKLLQDREQTTQMGQNAKNLISEKYNTEEHYQKILKIYNQIRNGN